MGADIALTWDAQLGSADFGIDANDLETDAGLETAVMLSLFTDRSAEPGDLLPTGEADRRGWWADALPVVDGDKIGSRLWLLARSKETPQVLARAEEYAREALQWLIDDRIADEVEIFAEVVSRGVLGISITIRRPKLDPVDYRYTYAWSAQEARMA